MHNIAIEAKGVLLTTDNLREITQSILALAIVIGGGVMLYFGNNASAVPFVTGTMGFVVGYYFVRNGHTDMLNKARESTLDTIQRTQEQERINNRENRAESRADAMNQHEIPRLVS